MILYHRTSVDLISSIIYYGTAIGDAAYVGNIVGWHSHKWEDRDTKNDTNSPKQNTKCLLRSPSPAHKKNTLRTTYWCDSSN